MTTENIDIRVREDGARVVNRSIASIGDGAERAAGGVDILKRALHGLAGAFAIQQVYTFTKAIFDASAAAQRLETQLNFATAGQGARELQFVTTLANRLGLEINSVGQAYGGFAAAARGTALEGSKARAVFQSLAGASAVMGLSADQTRGALLAVQQMMSKGTVQAEEFRGQLGERMPIALTAASRALGVTTAQFNKMLENGEVIAADFLPKFAQAIDEMLGDSVDRAANRLDAATARMGNSWERLKRTIGDSGISQAVANEMTGISNYLESVSDAMNRAKENGSGMVMQLSAGLGQMIARAPFDVLSESANLLNGALNAVSLGALKLRTNVNLLPDALKTTAQQSRELDGNLERARKEFAELQKLIGTNSDSIYLKSEMYQLRLYIEELERAKRKQVELAAPNATAEGLRIQGMARERYMQEQAAALDEFGKKFATPLEKAGQAIEEWKKKLGLAFTPEMEAKIREHYTHSIEKAEKASERLARQGKDLALGLVGIDSGLAPDFAEKWNKLSAAYKANAISLQMLINAQAALIQQQPFMQRQAELARETAEARQRARAKEAAGIEQYMLNSNEGGYAEALQKREAVVRTKDALMQGSAAGQTRELEVLLQSMEQLKNKEGSGYSQTDATNVLAQRAPDLFAGTQELANAQIEQFRTMYAQIDMMRQADVISEQTAGMMRARVAVQEQELRLSTVSGMFGQLATLSTHGNKKIAAIGKAAAVAQATIDGILAVQKALASAPPPLNYAIAAAVGVAQAANVAKIASSGYELGGYTGNAGRKEVSGVVHGQEFVINAKATSKHRELLEAINADRLPAGFGAGYALGGYVAPAAPRQAPQAPATPAAVPIAGAAAGRQPDAPNVQVPIKIVNVIDPDEVLAAMGTSEGERAILNVIERNPSAVRKLIG